MNYLTTTEVAQKWNISSRMIAYYCESNRIFGAVKKGKSWLIPHDANKPIDGRISKNKVLIENIDYSDETPSIDAVDFDNANKTYYTNELYANLGLTRELIRYYEDIGIISPNRNIDSNYREFKWEDIVQLMGIDFYKKRGFAPSEIRGLIDNKTKGNLLKALSDKQLALQETIQEYTNMLTKLNEAKSFYERNHNNFDNFEIKEFPLYEVVEMFDYGTSLEKYKKSVLPNIDKNQDIMSSLARIITFDNTKLLGSGMCVIKLVSSNEKRNTQHLESGKCIYTTIISDNKDEFLSETVFRHCTEWAISNGFRLKGVTYILLNFFELGETNLMYHEVWVPIET